MKVCEKAYKIIKREDIKKIAEELQIDRHAKKIKLYDLVLLHVGYVLLGFKSGNDLCKNGKLKGLPEISSGQFSKLNSKRDYVAFVRLFYELLHHPTLYRKYWKLRFCLDRFLCVAGDSTVIKIRHGGLKTPEGDELSDKEKKGIKIHLTTAVSSIVQPISAIVTPDNQHDNPVLDELLKDVDMLKILKEIILVFDKGYKDYERYRKLCDKEIFFVTQLQKNAKYEVLLSKNYERYIEQWIKIADMELKLIIYYDSQTWYFLTNVPEELFSAEMIREIYRLRWMIEILFREIKKELNCEHLISKNVNGIMIQIYATLIAYTIVNIFRLTYDLQCSFGVALLTIRYGYEKELIEVISLLRG